MEMVKRFILVCIGILSVGLIGAVDMVRERAYVRTDKRCYLSGELVWMKFLTTDAEGRPSSLSKVGYVELLEDSATVVVRAKLGLDGGRGEGCVELPATLPTGNYRLVAYTRYMRNEGEAVFFETPLAVVNTFVADERQEVDNVSAVPAFVRRPNTITLTPGQAEYTTRAEGEIRLNGLPADVHTLAVSVAGIDLYSPVAGVGGDSHIAVPGRGITAWLSNLPACSSLPFSGQVIPEYEGPIISGKMIDLSTGNPGGMEGVYALLSFSGEDIRLFGGQPDKEGKVTFFTRRVAGRHEAVTTTLSSFDHQFRIDIEEPFVSHMVRPLPPLRLNPAGQDALVKRSVGLQVLHAYTADSLSRVEKELPWFQREPDRRYILDEYTRFTTMEEVVIEFIPSLRFRRMSGKPVLSVLTEEQAGFTIGNSLVLLDGIPITDHEVIFKYDPLKVRTIDIYRGKYVFGGQIFDGITFFSTYKLNYPGLTLDSSTQFFDFEGTQAPRLLYMPSYPTEESRRSPVPDFRHTLLWMPEVHVDGQSSITIPFTTSDLTGDFIITVEGLTKEGRPILATEHFRVK